MPAKHVAIVGAGLVGTLLSIYLRKRGYTITIFERRSDIRVGSSDAGRSINLALSTRGIRALKEIGLGEIVKQIAIPMHGRTMHDMAGKLSFLPYGVAGQYINSISRTDLNVILLNEAEKLGVTVLFDHRCVNIDLEKTRITWTNTTTLNPLETSPTDISSQSFDLIIGADGAYSAVRTALQYTDQFDFSQHYIEHGYKELHIPPAYGSHLEKNALHIWPRESFMMIALPNADGSFTCTLFFPFKGFDTLKTEQEIKHFFQQTFPDAYALMPTLLEDFTHNPTSSLITIKCFPWFRNKTLLIGDAAHAVVPFYGQGMNAGFEDCRILNALLDAHHDNWDAVLREFQNERKPDADAIAQLALDNFIEMRDHVADAQFLLRKKIEAKLHALFPDQWIPLYTMVTFRDDIRYSEAKTTGEKQRQIMDHVMSRPEIFSTWETLDFREIAERLQK